LLFSNRLGWIVPLLVSALGTMALLWALGWIRF
jgi:hypothetical protein